MEENLDEFDYMIINVESCLNGSLTTFDTIDLILNYNEQTSTWIGIDASFNIDNYKFIYLASFTGNVIVNSQFMPKTVFKCIFC